MLIDGHPKAYPLELIANGGLFNDTLAGQPFVGIHDAGGHGARACARGKHFFRPLAGTPPNLVREAADKAGESARPYGLLVRLVRFLTPNGGLRPLKHNHLTSIRARLPYSRNELTLFNPRGLFVSGRNEKNAMRINATDKLKPYRYLICVLLILSLVGCATSQEGGRTKTVIGGLGGAAAGGFLAAAVGGNTAGIIAGSLIGGLVGAAVGDRLDAADRREAREAAQRSLETSRSGTTTTWQNPDSGNHGSITPTRTYQAASGQYCREYKQTITVDGDEHRGYGTACRQPDGSWKIVS